MCSSVYWRIYSCCLTDGEITSVCFHLLQIDNQFQKVFYPSAFPFQHREHVAMARNLPRIIFSTNFNSLLLFHKAYLYHRKNIMNDAKHYHTYRYKNTITYWYKNTHIFFKTKKTDYHLCLLSTMIGVTSIMLVLLK